VTTRKVLLTLALLVMLLSIPNQQHVFANLEDTSPGEPPNPPELPYYAKNIDVKARLTSDNDNQFIDLTPVFVEAFRTGPNSFAVAYEVGIPPEYLIGIKSDTTGFNINDLFTNTAFAGSESHYGCDYTVSVCAKIYLYYVDFGDHGYYQYMTNKWTRSDPTVSWSNAYLQAGCNAEYYSKPGRCSTQTTRYIGTPISGTTYYYYPPFRGSSNMVLLNYLNGIAAYQYVTLKRVSSTWSFAFYVNHEGNGVIWGCY